MINLVMITYDNSYYLYTIKTCLQEEYNDENSIVFNIKIKVLKVLDLFFDFRIYLRLQVSTNLNYNIINITLCF